MIEEVKQIFDDIRDAIIEMGGNIDVCTSPEEYDEAIKTLAGNNAVLCIPVFKSLDTTPAKPTKAMTASNPTDYPEGWGTPDGLTGNIGMSYCVVSSSTTYVPGTEPLLVKEVRGLDPGVSYDDATTRTFLIFTEIPTLELVPDTPIGGQGNVVSNTLDGDIISNVPGGSPVRWEPDNNHIDGCYTGMSNGTFLAKDGSQIGNWSPPICINSVRDGKDGKPGRNGVDGTDIEFIYRLYKDETAARSAVAPYSDPEQDDYIPDPKASDIGKGGGSDSPQGIDPENFRAEVMSVRTKGPDGGGEFSNPQPGAIGGEDGTDGDGIEYIFRVASNNEVTQDLNGVYHLNNLAWPPTCEEDCPNGFLRVARMSSGFVSDEDALQAYNQDEFIPGNNEVCPDAPRLGGDRNWTDDPRDVDLNEPFEFVSIRRYNGETKKWSGFSEPVLWNKYYVTSAPIFTSFVFCRSTKKLGNMQLTGGTVLNPIPDDQTVDGELIHGYDGIPGAAEYPNSTRAVAPIGMASSKFGSANPTEVIAANWTSPMLLADNKYFNVEYSNSQSVTTSTALPRFDETISGSKPFVDLTNPEGVNEIAGRNYCTQHGLGTGGDDVADPKGMATCTFDNGQGSDGTITQIKGEKGERGVDGDGVEYVYVRTNSNVAPTITDSDDTYQGKTYIDDDYLPVSSAGRCTDDPVGVDSTHQFEGVAKRTKGNPDSSGIRTGSRYSGTMALGSNGAKDGVSYVLTPSVNTLVKATDGTISPSTVSCSAVKLIGGVSSTLDGTLKYTLDGSATETTYNNAVSTAGITSNIKFLYYVNSSVVAQVTVSVVNQGQRGPIGPKMRMRNWDTTYTLPGGANPDAEGTAGGQCGDNPDDVFYDIAIGPNSEDVSIPGVTSDPSKLGRCTQNLDYNQVTANSTPEDYPNNFTQAVGGDFIATKLLLAQRIAADQIDASGISTDVLTTTADSNGGYIDARGNTLVLKNGIKDVCKVTGDPLDLDADHNTQYAGNERLGGDFMSSTAVGLHFSRTVGRIVVPDPGQGQQQTDYFASAHKQYIGFRVEATATRDGNFSQDENTCNATIFIKIKNRSNGQTSDGHSGGYSEHASLPGGSHDGYQYYNGQTTRLGYAFEIDTTVSKTIAPGEYDIIIEGDVGCNVLRDHTNQKIYVSQYQSIANGNTAPSGRPQSGEGFFSPIVWYHSSVTGAQTTEIAADGFGHAMNSDNYFFIKHLKEQQDGVDVDTNTLILEFVTNGTYGLQISKAGIKYTTNGGTTGNTNGAALNS